MNITFYTTSDPPKKLEKTLTAIGNAHALSPTAEVTVLNPVIVCNYNAQLLAANYCYIDTFQRYYFCSLATDTASRLIVSCTCDYLMSWADYIKRCPANIIRAEQAGVNYVVDRQLPIDSSRFFIEGKRFDLTPLQYTEDTPYKYLLITN